MSCTIITHCITYTKMNKTKQSTRKQNFKTIFVKISVFIIIMSSFVDVKSQYYPLSFYKSTEIDSSRQNSLFFKIENSNFLKNNEFFGDFIQGYTLIGYNIAPSLIYYPTSKSKLEVGVHFLKYSGIEHFTKTLPLLRFQYKIHKAIDVVIGSLYGTANHNIIEPLFRHEFFYTDPVENGLQFLFNTKKYKGDIWINWQQFIFKGDDKQEIFTLGIANRFFLYNFNDKHHLTLPLQTIFVHQGGQINETSAELVTLNNSAIGLNYRFTPNGLIKHADFESLFLTFNDMSTVHQYPYIQGFGVYSRAAVKVSYFELQVAHWYGNSYMSGRGLPVINSTSTIYKGYTEDERATINTRLLFEKNIVKGLDIGAGFEVFSDLYNYTGDYWYLFYINFNRDFFIKKWKQSN